MIEGRAGGRADAGRGQVAELGQVGEHADLADIAARPDVIQHPFAPRPGLADFHKPGSHQVDPVGRAGTLAEDHLARLAPPQRDLLAQPADQLVELAFAGECGGQHVEFIGVDLNQIDAIEGRAVGRAAPFEAVMSLNSGSDESIATSPIYPPGPT